MIWLNGKKLNIERFPNGEARLDGEQITSVQMPVTVTFHYGYNGDADLIHLMFVRRVLNEMGIQPDLRLLYMPYSRMDRRELQSTVFTLKYVADFINSLNFHRIEVVEPHSDVTCALLNNAYPSYPTFELIDKVAEMVGFDKEKDYLFFPDAGAQKRYSKMRGYQSMVGHKNRNFSTGEILGLEISNPPLYSGFKVIIVDDLCSYGGTFLASAERLRNAGSKEIYLFVTHAENSIHRGKLLDSDLILKVFTTNSLLDPCGDVEKIHQFDIIGGEM